MALGASKVSTARHRYLALPSVDIGNAVLATVSVGFLLLLIALPLSTIFTRAGENGIYSFW